MFGFQAIQRVQTVWCTLVTVDYVVVSPKLKQADRFVRCRWREERTDGKQQN